MDSQNNSVLTQAYDLLKLMLDLVKNFPRDQKFLLGDRQQNLCSDMLELYIEAFYTGNKEQKKEKLLTANIQLEKLRFFLRLAHEKNLISTGRYRETSERIQELGRMTGGWLKKL